MDDSHSKKFSKDLNGGLVSLVLLAVLDRSPEDLYGYDIVKRLQRANEGELLFKEGTVYPVLRALSASGLLTRRSIRFSSGIPAGQASRKAARSRTYAAVTVSW